MRSAQRTCSPINSKYSAGLDLARRRRRRPLTHRDGYRLVPVGRCPIPGCGDRVDRTRLMCRHDWCLVPRQLRDRVGDLALWRRSRQPRAPGGSAPGHRRLPRRQAARLETPAHPVPPPAHSRPAPCSAAQMIKETPAAVHRGSHPAQRTISVGRDLAQRPPAGRHRCDRSEQLFLVAPLWPDQREFFRASWPWRERPHLSNPGVMSPARPSARTRLENGYGEVSPYPPSQLRALKGA